MYCYCMSPIQTHDSQELNPTITLIFHFRQLALCSVYREKTECSAKSPDGFPHEDPNGSSDVSGGTSVISGGTSVISGGSLDDSSGTSEDSGGDLLTGMDSGCVSDNERGSPTSAGSETDSSSVASGSSKLILNVISKLAPACTFASHNCRRVILLLLIRVATVVVLLNWDLFSSKSNQRRETLNQNQEIC